MQPINPHNLLTHPTTPRYLPNANPAPATHSTLSLPTPPIIRPPHLTPHLTTPHDTTPTLLHTTPHQTTPHHTNPAPHHTAPAAHHPRRGVSRFFYQATHVLHDTVYRDVHYIDHVNASLAAKVHTHTHTHTFCQHAHILSTHTHSVNTPFCQHTINTPTARSIHPVNTHTT